MAGGYRGRFAPSPTGALHAGSLVAALASWLDARAHGGQWLLRIEDLDTPRCVPGADATISAQLQACGLISDEPATWQSRRHALYRRALDRLIDLGLAYPCACTRAEVERKQLRTGHARGRHAELIYPGTCRPENGGLRGRPPRAWRLRVPGGAAGRVDWTDRRLGPQTQQVDEAVGDFVLLRADGVWAYQLAVVVDDAEQGITHVVRGEDLADNTPRQICLQRALSLGTPRYLHTPLVLGPGGEKLSKQNGAAPLALASPAEVLMALQAATATLGLGPQAAPQGPGALAAWLQQASAAWAARWAP